MIGIMVITFGIEFGMSKPDVVELLKGVAIPRIPKGTLIQTVSLLGAVIMPHNIYFHSALVQVRFGSFFLSATHRPTRLSP